MRLRGREMESDGRELVGGLETYGWRCEERGRREGRVVGKRSKDRPTLNATGLLARRLLRHAVTY